MLSLAGKSVQTISSAQSSSEPTQSSILSHISSSSKSAVHEPPHTSRASSVFPLQSQSPAGTLVQPQLYTAPGPLHTPQSSKEPEHVSTSSHTPSLSSSLTTREPSEAHDSQALKSG